MRLRTSASWAAMLLMTASPLRASLQIKIVEVFAGTEAAPDAQYVVLETYASGQNLVNGQSIYLFDPSGHLIPGGTFTFTSNAVGTASQTKILIATPAAQTFFGVTPDLAMTPVVGRAGGALCLDAAPGGAYIDCVAWGGYMGLGGASGTGTPFGTPAGIATGQSLKRRLDICGLSTDLDSCDDTDDSANDFTLGPPAPVNSAGTAGVVPAAICANGTLEGLEGCDDGNSSDGDGCSSSCRVEAAGFVAQALVVDPAPTGTSNGNGILEQGEVALLVPTWKNTAVSVRSLLGSASSFLYSSSPESAIPDGNADYGVVASNASSDCLSSTGDCYRVSGSPSSGGTAIHRDLTYTEVLNNGDVKPWTVHIGSSFSDVPPSHPFYRFVETILHNEVTGGCQLIPVPLYCPDDPIRRDQMAVFLLASNDGPGYTPPACVTPTFSDVPCSNVFSAWVDEIAARGVTAGCAAGLYCPDSPVTRAQMAVFLLRTREGPSYVPPACTTPMFADVPCSNGFARWVDELASRGITAGCGGGDYCPDSPVSRGQMAVFLTTTFGLVLYGP